MTGSEPGTYVLLLYASRGIEVSVGKLGRFRFPGGWYLYVGSAFGPGGVAARCGHHRRISEHPRWHIDYLRAVTHLRQIWFTHDPVPREHQWAKYLAGFMGLNTPAREFGASDCDCVSHLFHSVVKPEWWQFEALSASGGVGVSPVYCEIV